MLSKIMNVPMRLTGNIRMLLVTNPRLLDFADLKVLFLAVSLLLTVFVSPDAGAKSRLRVALVGDPQVDDSTELVYARRSIYRELRGRKDIDMAIILGDLVNDDMYLMQPSKASLDSLPYPYFCVPGNHDRDVYRKADGRPRDFVTYDRLFGRDTSFVVSLSGRNVFRPHPNPAVRFVMMNNVRTVGRAGYEGGFSERQKRYLDSLCSVTPQSVLMVLSVHIPVSQMKGLDTLVTIFAKHPEFLIVSGHTHNVRRHNLVLNGLEGLPVNESSSAGNEKSFGLPGNLTGIEGRLGVEEVQVGATCGSWWRGEKDSYGIPYALMNCGTPRGYFVADFTRQGYDLHYKPVFSDQEFSVASMDVSDRLAAGQHLAVSRHDKSQRVISSNGGTLPTAISKVLLVNIFGGHEDGVLEVRSGRRWYRAERVAETDPEVRRLINERQSLSREEYRKKVLAKELVPLRNIPSPHLWRVELPGPVRRLKFRYTDAHMTILSK